MKMKVGARILNFVVAGVFTALVAPVVGVEAIIVFAAVAGTVELLLQESGVLEEKILSN